MVYGLDTTQLTNAFGIAGSMSAGLLAFTKAQTGSMVKRLHMGRAGESGIVAAKLAADGYNGPRRSWRTFGFLETYCRNGDAALLTSGLGEDWETLKICIKRYPCHVTAQAPMQALRALQKEHGFDARDVASLTVWCNEKVVTHHDIRRPEDVMMAQYSVPFCLALALHRDPDDPDSFDTSALQIRRSPASVSPSTCSRFQTFHRAGARASPSRSTTEPASRRLPTRSEACPAIPYRRTGNGNAS